MNERNCRSVLNEVHSCTWTWAKSLQKILQEANGKVESRTRCRFVYLTEALIRTYQIKKYRGAFIYIK